MLRHGSSMRGGVARKKGKSAKSQVSLADLIATARRGGKMTGLGKKIVAFVARRGGYDHGQRFLGT